MAQDNDFYGSNLVHFIKKIYSQSIANAIKKIFRGPFGGVSEIVSQTKAKYLPLTCLLISKTISFLHSLSRSKNSFLGFFGGNFRESILKLWQNICLLIMQ